MYADPAVQRECLALQDEHGIDVNLVLFCAFVGAVFGAVLSDDVIEDAADLVRVWQSGVVRHLRAARQALKPFAANEAASPPGAAATALRLQVKASELEAERIEQTVLGDWATARVAAWPRARPAGAVADNIRTLFAVSARGAEQPALPHRLIAAALTVAGHQ